MRRCIPLLLLVASVAAGCGNDEENPALLTQARADELNEDLAQLRTAVAAGDCERVEGELRQLRATLAALPERTSVRLRTRIEQGVAELASVAVQECAEAEEEQTETTETQPPETTETVPPETTETTPPETTPAEPTQPPPTTAPAPQPEPEAPGGADPGGGLEAPQGVVSPVPGGGGRG